MAVKRVLLAIGPALTPAIAGHSATQSKWSGATSGFLRVPVRDPD